MGIDKNFKENAKSKRRVYLAPRVLNIPKEEKDRLLKQMQAAFKNRSNVDDSYLYARQVLKRCINGVAADGTPWRNAPGLKDDTDMEVLDKRLRVFNYNMHTGEIIAQAGRPKDVKRAVVQQFMPKEGAEIDKRLKYGASINEILTGEELKDYKKFLKKLQSEFPKLDAVSDRLGMEQLALLNIRLRRATLELASDKKKVLTKDVAELGKLYKDLTENLGISGKQRRDELDNEENGTISDLVRRYHETLKKYPKEEHDRYLQECQLMLNAYARGDIEEYDVVRNVNLGIKEVQDLLRANKIEFRSPSAGASKNK